MDIDNFVIKESDKIEKVEKKFNKYAKQLIENYIFYVNDKKYEIIDIECYWYSKNFTDNKNSYKRNNKKSGEIYVHRSGIDVCFKSDKKSYGGILIRGIKEVKCKNFIFGPKNVRRAIFEDKNYKICKKKRKICKIVKTYRIGLKAEKGKPDKKQYRYINFSGSLGKIQGIKQKKIIARHICEQFCKEKAIGFLGYKLTNFNSITR